MPFAEDRPRPLADLPLQYGDFAVWQKQWLESTDLDGQLSYWKEKLADLPLLEIKTDRPRPAIQTSNGYIESLVLPNDPHRSSDKRSAIEQGVTFFMLALAALKVMLMRHSAQSDIFVGTLVAGRSRVELEPLIGLFINPLVLRTDLSGDPTFPELSVAGARDGSGSACQPGVAVRAGRRGRPSRSAIRAGIPSSRSTSSTSAIL